MIVFQIILSCLLGVVGGLCLLAVQTISLFGVAFIFGLFFFAISGIISFVSFADCEYIFNPVAQVSSICYGGSIIALIILCLNIK